MTNVINDFQALAESLALVLAEQTQLLHQLTTINGEGASAE